MILTFSGRSRPSAEAIAEASGGEIRLSRSGNGDVNFGRNFAQTELNPDISNATNKRMMRELFASHDVPMPRLLREPERRLLESGVTFPLVGRPDYHSKGRGFWLCRDWQDVQRAMRGTRRKRAATHFMAFVEADREYRVHIFKGKSIRISEKLFNGRREGVAHTLYQYTTIKPRHDVKHVRKAAKKAVEALGLDYGAVDVLATDNEAWVLEVNAAPGLGGTTPELYARTFLSWHRGEW